jgi:large repetitive protein
VYQYSSASNTGPWAAAGANTVAADVTSTSFTVKNDSTWYEYTVAATNEAGLSAQSPMSAPLQAAVDPNPPTNVTETAAGPNTSVQVNFTVPAANAKQISSVEYGVNQGQESGTIQGPFTGATASVDITSAMSGQIANGTPVTIYVAACNDAGYCSPFVAAAAPAVPYGPIAAPVLTATTNGTTINYTWSQQSDGLTETLNVCITNDGCDNYTVPAAGGYNGQASVAYGYSTAWTISATAKDTANQTATANPQSGTTEAPPPPPETVAVARGQRENTTTGSCDTSNCYDVSITTSNFPANAVLNYSCSDNDGGQFWPKSGTTDLDWGGGVMRGNGQFYLQCIWGYWSDAGHTITITVNGVSGSYTG